jgi:ATP-binding cassette subfamily B (MDR/TAP) protein 1
MISVQARWRRGFRRIVIWFKKAHLSESRSYDANSAMELGLLTVLMNRKVANATMFGATFITGFALAYARSWRLALAMTSIFPVIMVAGAIMFGAMSKFTLGSLEKVAKAGTLAEEVIGSIRTMQAFGTSLILGKKFDKLIIESRNTGRRGSIIEALGLSIMCRSFAQL